MGLQVPVRVFVGRQFGRVELGDGKESYRPTEDCLLEPLAEMTCEVDGGGGIIFPPFTLKEPPVDEAGGPSYLLLYAEVLPEGLKYLATAHLRGEPPASPTLCLYRDDFAARVVEEVAH